MVQVRLLAVCLACLARAASAYDGLWVRRAQSGDTPAPADGSLELLASGATYEQVESSVRAALAIVLDVGPEALNITVVDQAGTPRVAVREPCSTERLPSESGGRDTGNCTGLRTGETCSVTCQAEYYDGSSPYACHVDGHIRGTELLCTKIICAGGMPDGLVNSTCSNKEVGGSCNVSCPVGFIENSTIFTCRTDTFFHGVAPHCERLACDPATVPTDTNVNVSACAGLVTTEMCTLTCDYGYQGDPEVIQCLNSGSFSGLAPVCEAIPCTLPADIDNAEYAHNCDGVVHGESCNVNCAAGYSGAPQATSCDAGTLTAGLPTCIGNECTTYFPTGDGINSTDCVGKRTGEMCIASCMAGFGASVPANVLVCGANGAFSASNLVCTRLTCANLSSVSYFAGNAIQHSCDGLVLGQSCSVYCATGYDIIGPAISLTCALTPEAAGSGGFVDGTSSPATTPPTCQARECTTGKPSLLGVTHDCDNKTTGETCTASAQEGYMYTSGGATTLTCEANGAFSGDVPSVEPATCGTIDFGPGSASTCNSKTLGTNCWAYCADQNYEGTMTQYDCTLVSGTATYVSRTGVDIQCTCKAGATCTRRLIELQQAVQQRTLGSCDLSEAAMGLVDVGVSHDCLGKGDTEACVVECSDGYELQGRPSLYHCREGRFVGEGLPTCKAKPCTMKFPSGEGVTHDCSGVTTDSTCAATCGGGYSHKRGSAPQTLTCQENGEFSSAEVSCEPAPCKTLALPGAYSHTGCEGKVAGQTCTVGCHHGFTLRDRPQVHTCLPNGTFSGALPTCVPRKCTKGLRADAKLNMGACSGLTTGESCYVSCADGLVGPVAEFTCSASGVLVGERPACVELVCEDTIPAAAALLHNCSRVPLRQSCVVTCDDDALGSLQASAVEEFTCTRDESTQDFVLEGSLPECNMQADGEASSADEQKDKTLADTHADSSIEGGHRLLSLVNASNFSNASNQSPANFTMNPTHHWMVNYTLCAAPEKKAQLYSAVEGIRSDATALITLLLDNLIANGADGLDLASAFALEQVSPLRIHTGGGTCHVITTTVTTTPTTTVTISTLATTKTDAITTKIMTTTIARTRRTTTSRSTRATTARGGPTTTAGTRGATTAAPGTATSTTNGNATNMGMCSDLVEAVCTEDPEELCFYDETCSDDPPWHGGLGCNAGGVDQNCRFCGFKFYLPCNLNRAEFKIPCTSEPAGVCSYPEEPCYFDPQCSELPPGLEGLGCNAGGVGQECRFCGFGVYPPCPMTLVI